MRVLSVGSLAAGVSTGSVDACLLLAGSLGPRTEPDFEPPVTRGTAPGSLGSGRVSVRSSSQEESVRSTVLSQFH